jgi:hypothetical protein
LAFGQALSLFELLKSGFSVAKRNICAKNYDFLHRLRPRTAGLNFGADFRYRSSSTADGNTALRGGNKPNQTRSLCPRVLL